MSRYVFRTRWLVRATPAEVGALLADPLDLPRWWPSVYLKVEKEGDVYKLLTQGLLPYRLCWYFRVPAGDPYALEAWGDLEGEGKWTLNPRPDGTEVIFDWAVEANKPLIKLLSPLLKPLFSANHDWAMARGLESLNLELRRRRGESAPHPRRPLRAAAGLAAC